MHSIDRAAPSQTHPPCLGIVSAVLGAALLTWHSAQTQPEMWGMGKIRHPLPVLCWKLFLRGARARGLQPQAKRANAASQRSGPKALLMGLVLARPAV